ncbi:ABC transporter permease [Thermotoga caldifontis]|uniref:ABC transporter permease n=1 Tax=Thermotoga caldifontis TaxID=1508419 RepID=UPI000597977D|nr:ABC transporter permease [Thermotoga caldifontis]
MRTRKAIPRELTLVFLLAVLCTTIGLFSHAFISFATLFEIIRGSIAFVIMSLGILPILIAGEFDLSFAAVGAFSAFATHHLLLKAGYVGGISLYLLIASALGLGAGLLIGLIASRFDLRIFPISLGFWLFWYGFNLYVISPVINFNLPEGLVGYYARYLITVRDPVIGVSGLHQASLYMIVFAVLMWLFLKYTIVGRSLYAIGGNREIAIRSGINVNRVLTIALMINGAFAGMAAVIQSAFYRYFTPILFRGQELSVIVGVILGGASVKGGRGSVLGAILGVFFIQVATRGLVYLGVKGEFQQLALGIILILFFVISSIRGMPPKRERRTQE